MTKLFNWDACRTTVSIVDYLCGTTDSRGSVSTWDKDWPDDMSDLKPAQAGILLR